MTTARPTRVHAAMHIPPIDRIGLQCSYFSPAVSAAFKHRIALSKYKLVGNANDPRTLSNPACVRSCVVSICCLSIGTANAFSGVETSADSREGFGGLFCVPFFSNSV